MIFHGGQFLIEEKSAPLQNAHFFFLDSVFLSADLTDTWFAIIQGISPSVATHLAGRTQD
jgi:hypothetical protein